MTHVVVGMEAAGRDRGTYPAQPCATRDSAQINSKRGIVRNQSRNSAAYQPLRMRAGGSDDRTLNRGGFLPNQFLPVLNSFRVLPGWSFLVRLHSAPALFQSSARSKADVFQVLSLSAQALGLAVGVVGQHTDRRKMKCPTKALKDSTK